MLFWRNCTFTLLCIMLCDEIIKKKSNWTSFLLIKRNDKFVIFNRWHCLWHQIFVLLMKTEKTQITRILTLIQFFNETTMISGFSSLSFRSVSKLQSRELCLFTFTPFMDLSTMSPHFCASDYDYVPRFFVLMLKLDKLSFVHTFQIDSSNIMFSIN